MSKLSARQKLFRDVERARIIGITPGQLNWLQHRIAVAFNHDKIDKAEMGALQSDAARATVLRDPRFNPTLSRPGGGPERRQFYRTEEQSQWHSGNTTTSNASGTKR